MEFLTNPTLLDLPPEATLQEDNWPYGGCVYVHVNPYALIMKIGKTGVGTDRAFFDYLRRHGVTNKGWVSTLRFELESDTEAHEVEQRVLEFYETNGRRYRSPSKRKRTEIVSGVFWPVLPLIEVMTQSVRGESVSSDQRNRLNGALKTEKTALKKKMFIDPRNAFFADGLPNFSELRKLSQSQTL